MFCLSLDSGLIPDLFVLHQRYKEYCSPFFFFFLSFYQNPSQNHCVLKGTFKVKYFKNRIHLVKKRSNDMEKKSCFKTLSKNRHHSSSLTNAKGLKDISKLMLMFISVITTVELELFFALQRLTEESCTFPGCLYLSQRTSTELRQF